MCPNGSAERKKRTFFTCLGFKLSRPVLVISSPRNSIIISPLNRAKLGLHEIINPPSIVLKPVPVLIFSGLGK